MLGSQEIIIILVIIAVIFGASKLPQIGDGLGKAIKNFKKSVKEVEDATDITPNNEKEKINHSAESVQPEKKTKERSKANKKA